MRLVLLGPPGAGKGTQAELLSDQLGVPHISTGNLFRANISQETPLGLEAKKFLDAGDLVPSEVTNRMVEARIAEPDAVNGFVLDGYPRTVDQAEALEKMLKESGHELDAVVSFEVADDVVVQRMLGRGRADDTEDVIRNRMRVYRDETEPLLQHYDGAIVSVEGVGEVDEVNARVLRALGR
ncbi:adenylate kinase [Nocardia sp. alder85J]|uniref:adenylate kinase n=1 Tax=Nocardia sp. alder85J TaxID=2862949 RepID=UPI001CD6BF49|nr:adenylate kinase [Nocardia sp. alder85J]MCX4093100.1 adenylate kinase [Nocardia sp. alder85J]